MKMSEIWNKKIDELTEQINNVEIGKDGRLIQLYDKKANLEIAFLRCLGNENGWSRV